MTDTTSLAPLGVRALAVANSHLGWGELQGQNNQSPWLTEIRAELRAAYPTAHIGEGEWCATFASWCLHRALEPGEPLGFLPSSGARALGRAILASERGRLLEVPEPGAFLLQKRPSLIPWAMHIEICHLHFQGQLVTVPGNVVERRGGPALVHHRTYFAGSWRARTKQIVMVL